MASPVALTYREDMLSSEERKRLMRIVCFELSRIPLQEDQDVEDQLYACSGDMLGMSEWNPGNKGTRCICPQRVLNTAEQLLRDYGRSVPGYFHLLSVSFPTNIWVSN
jgi:hypothetical protein